MATGAALKLADYVVTEAGFGADLGAGNSSTSNAARLEFSNLVGDGARRHGARAQMHGGLR